MCRIVEKQMDTTSIAGRLMKIIQQVCHAFLCLCVSVCVMLLVFTVSFFMFINH